jgi:hypothetical protein
VKCLQPSINVDVIGWKNLHLDFGRPILEAAGTICNRPQSDEKQPMLKWELYQHFVLEKARLDVS